MDVGTKILEPVRSVKTTAACAQFIPWLLVFIPWFLVAVVILLAAAIRVRLLEFPLERDEGEYAYAGQLILQGVPPYELAYNMKLPGVYASYAALMAVFGQTTAGVHRGLILVNSITIILIYLLGRRLFGAAAGVAATAAYALMSMGQGVLGISGHATHFIVVFAMAGSLALLRATDAAPRPATPVDDDDLLAPANDRQGGPLAGFFLSGALFGVAFLMKQHAVFLIVGGLLWTLITQWRQARSWRQGFGRAIVFGLGSLAPFGLTCLILAWAGVFDRFWFWTFKYAQAYVSQVSAEEAWELFSDNASDAVMPNLALWAAAAVGLAVAWRKRSWRRSAAFMTGALVCSFLAICPGLYFRSHYFIVLLPCVALLAGAAADCVNLKPIRLGQPATWARLLPSLLFLGCLGWSLYVQWPFLLEMHPAYASRDTYGRQPFVESEAIADYIKAHTTPDDRIAVLGSEPQILFLSGRRSATGYIYLYPLLEDHAFAGMMRDEMIAQIETARPKFVVEALYATCFFSRVPTTSSLAAWADSYLSASFDLVGKVVITWEGTTAHWDELAAVEYEVAAKDLPENVIDGCRNAYPKGVIKKALRIGVDDKVVYELLIESDEISREFTVNVDGICRRAAIVRVYQRKGSK
jgi:4-amino-4-deoxy-L-arabinose transferase-like glycosyltransferase